jgi:hypothetical protein
MAWRTITVTIFAVELSCAAFAFADITGRVVRVLDGDTIEVLHNTHAERIRLNGIDCPEGMAYESILAHVSDRRVDSRPNGSAVSPHNNPLNPICQLDGSEERVSVYPASSWSPSR